MRGYAIASCEGWPSIPHSCVQDRAVGEGGRARERSATKPHTTPKDTGCCPSATEGLHRVARTVFLVRLFAVALRLASEGLGFRFGTCT